MTAPKCVEGRLAYKHNAAWSTSPPRIGRPSACVSSPRVPLSLYLSGSPSACVSPGSASACLYTPGPPLSPRLFTPGLSQPVSLHHGSVPAACIYSSQVYPLICVSSFRILISLSLFITGLSPQPVSIHLGSIPSSVSLHPGSSSACVSSIRVFRSVCVSQPGFPSACVSHSGSVPSACLFNLGPSPSLRLFIPGPPQPVSLTRVPRQPASLAPGAPQPAFSRPGCPSACVSRPGSPSACVSHPGPSPQPASLTRVPLSLRLSPRVRSPACLQAHLLGVGTPGLSVPAFSAAVLAPIFQLLP